MIYARLNGKYIGVEPGTTEVYANRPIGGAWEELDIFKRDDGKYIVTFISAQLVLSIQPDGRLETRPLGTDKSWEQLSIKDNVLFREGIDVSLQLEGFVETIALQSLHIDGDDLKTEDGKRWVVVGCSDYMLPQLVAEGVDIVPLLYRGPNTLRFFNTHGYISDQVGLKRFHPDVYGMSQWLQANEKAIDIANEHGYYIEANLICDNQLFNKDVNFLRNLQNQFCEMFRKKKGIYSLGNENDANGFNANDFDKPSGLIAACGSGLTGGPAPLSRGQPWDLQFQHLRRDEKMFIDIPPVDAPTYHLNHRLLFDETIGFANYDDAGKRSKNKNWAYKIGKIASAFNGAIIHLDSGSHSRPLNGDEQGCVDEFVRGSQI
jgi:hypothetical protein